MAMVAQVRFGGSGGGWHGGGWGWGLGALAAGALVGAAIASVTIRITAIPITAAIRITATPLGTIRHTVVIICIVPIGRTARTGNGAGRAEVSVRENGSPWPSGQACLQHSFIVGASSAHTSHDAHSFLLGNDSRVAALSTKLGGYRETHSDLGSSSSSALRWSAR